MHHPSHHHHFHPSSTTSQPLELITDPTASAGSNKWAPKLLRECAQAISDKDSPRIQHLLWMLNELSSPYGDYDEKLASYFLQALFCKATDSGDRSFRTLASAAERSHSFDSARKVILKFQEVSPWTTFGHVASNGAILEAFEGEPKLHIIDISNTYCTQWPTLLESLATRSDDTPHLRLSVVTASNGGSVMKEIGQRMEKFARLMGVPFEFRVVSGFSRLSELKEEDFEVKEDEAVAVNCIGALRRVSVEERRGFVGLIRSLRPKVVTVVEEEADFTSTRGEFVKCFEECLRFYGVFFEMKEEIERLLYDNGILEGFFERFVPEVVDRETFWRRYFYRVYRLKQAEDARAKLVKRVIEGEEEEELSWEVDDDDENNDDTVEEIKETKNEKKVEAEAETSEKAPIEEAKDKEVVEQLEETIEEVKEEEEISEPVVEKKPVETSEVENSEEEEKNEPKGEENSCSKTEGKVDPEARSEPGESSKDSDFTVVSSQPSIQEEDDLGWDEIEDLGDHDDKKISKSSGSPKRVDLRKKMNVAEDDEDLSWDIEDDED